MSVYVSVCLCRPRSGVVRFGSAMLCVRVVACIFCLCTCVRAAFGAGRGASCAELAYPFYYNLLQRMVGRDADARRRRGDERGDGSMGRVEQP